METSGARRVSGRPPTPLDSPSDALPPCARLGGRQVRNTPFLGFPTCKLQFSTYTRVGGHGLAQLE